ncbi:hypothetical protein [Bacillus inaquosorum]
MRKKCTMLMFMVIASFLFLEASAAGKEILASIPQKDRPYLAQ